MQIDIRFVSPGPSPPYEVHAFAGIPQGGLPVKYELDQKSGALFVDRFLHTSMLYPSITDSSPIRSLKTATRSTFSSLRCQSSPAA